jgi:hypothetical protein
MNGGTSQSARVLASVAADPHWQPLLDRIERQQADFNAALDRGQAALDRAAEAIARAEHLLGETA